MTSNISFANELILQEFVKESQSKSQKLLSFSASDGEKMFRNERINSEGKKISCMTCHTTDPKLPGFTRANKRIEPMAVSINPERFKEMSKVQKWFKRNCNDVYERDCTIQEKGNFTKFMMTIK